MSREDPASALEELFDADRAAQQAEEKLLRAADDALIPLLEGAADKAMDLAARDAAESSLRLLRIARLLGELEGPRVVDLLVRILESPVPEVRRAAGEALVDLAMDRFKEVALGVERAISRLPPGSPALAELPYVLAPVPEPGVVPLLGRFLSHRDEEAVAAAIESLVEVGDPRAIRMLEPLRSDTRQVDLDEDAGTDGRASIGELASEAIDILGEREAR